MSDLFHEDVPDSFIEQVFEVMQKTQRHTFMVLTKRAARMEEYLLGPNTEVNIQNVIDDSETADGWIPPTQHAPLISEWPLPNVWLGVSCEDQAEVDRYNNSPDVPVFLISLKAGGTGLNLTGSWFEIDEVTGEKYITIKNLILPAFTLFFGLLVWMGFDKES